MEDKITINLLNREELDPKLYDIIRELRDKFGIEGWIEVKIKDEDKRCLSNFCGGTTLLFSIRLRPNIPFVLAGLNNRVWLREDRKAMQFSGVG
jgi:hypothetical protein